MKAAREVRGVLAAGVASQESDGAGGQRSVLGGAALQHTHTHSTAHTAQHTTARKHTHSSTPPQQSTAHQNNSTEAHHHSTQ